MSHTTTPSFHKTIASTFRALSQPARLKILVAIGGGEACVCHLEAALGMRQAYISQQLMALRQENIVESRRDGRNIYYRVRDAGTLQLIAQAAGLAGFSDQSLDLQAPTPLLDNCPCPHCSGEPDCPPGEAQEELQDE